MGVQYAVKTCTLIGVDAVPVTVEVDVARGLPGVFIVGMPDKAVQEAHHRVKSALRASGFTLPDARIVINLAPGPLKKSGSGFDLPIAVALLCATRQIDDSWVGDSLVVGELALGGQVRAVRGLLAHALAARRMDRMLVSYPEAELGGIEHLRFGGLRTLAQLHQRDSWVPIQASDHGAREDDMDYSDIVGEDIAKRAMQIAAAGQHGVLLMGPPGSGKTMLAKRLPTILPPLEGDERYESALIHSVAGLEASAIFSGRRPFRAPHHSASVVGLIGGGNPIKPGEVSLAHNGVLYLDEMPEFAPSALQALRQPLESGEVVIVRSDYRVRFPADFVLVGSSNPCPCGYFGDSERSCTCTSQQISRYMGRIGGPLMDRIDIVVDVWRTDPGNVLKSGGGTSSAKLLEAVHSARERKSARDALMRADFNGHPSSTEQVLAACNLSDRDREAFEEVARRNHLSGRGIMSCLKVARTIADIEESERVCQEHIFEALSYRVREEVGA